MKNNILNNIYKYTEKEMVDITIEEPYFRGYCITSDKYGYDAWDIEEIITCGLIDAITSKEPEIGGCDTLEEIRCIICENIGQGIYENR